MRALRWFLLLLLMFVAGLAGVFFWLEGQVHQPARAGEISEVTFTVPPGASARALGPLLAQEGLVTDVRLWRYFLWRRGHLSAKAGRFQLRRDMAIPALATALEGSPLPEDQPFVVVEGWRLRDTDAALAQAGLIEAGQYLAAALKPGQFKAPFLLPTDTLEGYLYPETYRVPQKGLDPVALIQVQLDTFVRRVFAPRAEAIAKQKLTLRELVVMASMLEREEPSPSQRPTVAGILWKRIDLQYPLGVDATSRYRLPEWNDRKHFLERLRDPSDPYNSRLRKGLPPTPIGSPSEASFEAALHPVQSKYLYYLHDASKVLHPSENAEEHEKLRKRYNVY